ncbi:ADP-ribosylglycohydrolase family protein [Luteolibacter ambystomatis]|uniref:ADP-ribosylglycohydrolase family protein n=1 Tax=Luteolibacter ambystomatis TaxID=2824561 RepID=A0A975G7W5_9BACT|nr:ADP-ribosylglycohydrolase family protein [Luteolibacter ambystomatis]QUE50437.1 ADP-ribosylglycohydrolase family protein [Luteolibacter ambystomatis]
MTSRDLVLPAFFGDALALGAHWIYDDAEIAEAFPAGITNYSDPRSDYHPGKQAGDFTHYGDQTLMLLESLDRHRGFDPAAWRKDWLAFWRGKPNSYLDGATRRTLENSTAGLDRPSDSHDLGGASRIAALFALHFASDEEAVTAARAQTTLTHGDPRVAAVAEFLTLATRRVLEGASFSQAFEAAAATGMPDLDAAMEASRGTNEDLVDLGLSCDVAKAFPLMVALALKYENEPVTALRENARLGGDSAARGIPLGLLMGAKHGLSAFPAAWSSELTKFERISSVLERLALLPA